MRAGARRPAGRRQPAGRRRPLHAGIYQRRHWLKLLPQYVNAHSPPNAGERVGVEGGVEMRTYWRPTVPNPHASPKVRCAVSEI